jgi:hypothetical protein
MKSVVACLFATILVATFSQNSLQKGTDRDRPEAIEFLHGLQKCVAEDNRSCVASLIEYPIGFAAEQGTGTKELIIRSPDELFAHFNEVFGPLTRKVLSSQPDDSLTLEWGRVYVVGDDYQIWFERRNGNGFKVTAIGVAKYHLAGLEDAREAESFFRDFQSAVRATDRRRVCSMVDYPIAVVLSGHPVKFANARQLSRSYDLVFNSKVRNAVLQQAPSRLRPNWRGLIVGDGEIWFTKEADSDAFKVIAINP